MVGEMFTGKNKWKDREQDRDAAGVGKREAARFGAELDARRAAEEYDRQTSIPRLMEANGWDEATAAKEWARATTAKQLESANAGQRAKGYRDFAEAAGVASGAKDVTSDMATADEARARQQKAWNAIGNAGEEMQAENAEFRRRRAEANAKAASALRDTTANTKLLEGQAESIANRNLFDVDANEYQMRARPPAGVVRLANEAEATARATTARMQPEVIQAGIKLKNAQADQTVSLQDRAVQESAMKMFLGNPMRTVNPEQAWEEAESKALRMQQALGRATTATNAPAAKPITNTTMH